MFNPNASGVGALWIVRRRAHAGGVEVKRRPRNIDKNAPELSSGDYTAFAPDRGVAQKRYEPPR